MNDFTKEELIEILEGVSWWLEGDDAPYSEDLINKIQSMIDNYCEHEWNYDQHERPTNCIKCGMQF